MKNIRHAFADPRWQTLVRRWEKEEIGENDFVIAAAVLLGMTEGEIRDMIDDFEI